MRWSEVIDVRTLELVKVFVSDQISSGIVTKRFIINVLHVCVLVA